MAAIIVLVGTVLALGNNTPIVGIDGLSFEAVRSCELPHMWFTPIYSCHTWPSALSDPLSISAAPLLPLVVLLAYMALWVRSRFTCQ